MFSDLTDKEIKRWKRELCRFLRDHAGKASITIPGTSVTYSYDQCWKILEELKKEEDSRSGRRSIFIATDLRGIDV